MEKKKRKKVLITAFLVFALFITGIFAFLTATDSKTNEFTVGRIKIELHEDDWFDEDDNLILDNKVINKSLEEIKTNLEDEGYTFTENIVDGNRTVIAEKEGESSITYTEKSVNGEIKVFETNGINDFAELVEPGNEFAKAPYIKNIGDNPAFMFVTVGIPVAERSELISEANGDTPIEEAKFKIPVKAYGIQTGTVSKTAETPEQVWDAYTTDINANDRYLSLFGAETNNENLEEIFNPLEINDGWVQIGSTYHTDDYNYYVFAFEPEDADSMYFNNTVLAGNDTPAVFSTVSIREIIGASEPAFNAATN